MQLISTQYNNQNPHRCWKSCSLIVFLSFSTVTKVISLLQPQPNSCYTRPYFNYSFQQHHSRSRYGSTSSSTTSTTTTTLSPLNNVNDLNTCVRRAPVFTSTSTFMHTRMLSTTNHAHFLSQHMNMNMKPSSSSSSLLLFGWNHHNFRQQQQQQHQQHGCLNTSTLLMAKPKSGNIVDNYQTVSVNCKKCKTRLFRYKKKNGTKSNLIKCYVERIAEDCQGLVEKRQCSSSNSSNSSSSSTQDDNFHEHMNMSNDDQSNNGDWICPNCDTKFGRDSMIHGKPAIKLVGGKTQMTKK